jgi:hypothetical protein
MTVFSLLRAPSLRFEIVLWCKHFQRGQHMGTLSRATISLRAVQGHMHKNMQWDSYKLQGYTPGL